MIAGLKPYAATKDSGTEWLGQTPTHWHVPRIKDLFQEKDRRSGDGKGTLLSLTRERGIVPHTDISNRAASASDLSKYKVCMPGELVMNRMQAWSGMFAVSPFEGLISPDYCVFRLNNTGKMCVKYFEYVFKTPRFVEQFAMRSKGIGTGFNRLYTPDFGAVQITAPPCLEQFAIVRFLNHADRQFRRYIGAKQKLIALLEEQKQAIAHQAVTGEIDVRTQKPYSAYKDSGVEWLGAIPSHWDVLRLGKVIGLTVGFPFKSEGFTESEEDIRLLRGINIAPGQLRWDDVVRWPASNVEGYTEFQLVVGDIILGMDRPIIGSGVRVAVVNEPDVPSLLLQRVARIRPIEEKLTREFAVRLLCGISFSEHLAPMFTGISVPHLSPDQIRGFRVALPSLAEQEAIRNYLNSIADRITRAVSRTRAQISVMRELRTRLIADAVTGKFDTREAAATLSETDIDGSGDCSDDGCQANGRWVPDGLGPTRAEAEA